jgi:(p)ppGpp synthase/HD superfamily hydrolase
MDNIYAGQFADALQYALAIHGKQGRKGAGQKKITYITHLLSVAALVGEQGGTEDEVIAALLHDAIEDHPREGKTEQDILSLFGNNVLALVAGCTNVYDSKDMPMRLTKGSYIKHIEAFPDSWRIVLSDKLHNARTTVMNLRADGGEAVWSRFRGGREDTLWYYRSLADLFERLMPGEFSSELTATVYLMHAMANTIGHSQQVNVGDYPQARQDH